MDKVIESIKKLVMQNVYSRETAEAILNLCYGCEECEGSGKRVKDTYPDDGRPITERWLEPCPDCKMLAILDPNQDINMPNPYHDNASDEWKDGFKFAVYYLKEQNWRKMEMNDG